MKKHKISLPIIISSIILVVALAIPFIIFGSSSSSVAIRGVKGSYAESFANSKGIEFVELYDSENENVAVPTEETTAAETEETTEAVPTTPANKENKDFTYNYEGKTVNVTGYKGNASEIIVPSEIDGMPVSAVTLTPGKNVKIVEIPEGVTRIEGSYKNTGFTPAFFAAIVMLLIGYAFAILSTFIGMKKAETAESTFYGVPFVYSGVVTFAVICVWSYIAMFFNIAPLTQLIVDIVILAVAAIKLFSKNAARDIIEERGKEVKVKTMFIKMLTADVMTLEAKAKSAEIKAVCNKVYETVRYSDPMSDDALAGVESQISLKFASLTSAVENDDTDNAKTYADELIILIEDRNKRCKLLK